MSDLAARLAAITGHPATDWDRLLDAHAVAGIHPGYLLDAVAEGHDIDPAAYADHLEHTMAYASGRLNNALRTLGREIRTGLTYDLRRIFHR